MSEEHNPDRNPDTPDGYFGWPEGQDSVQFLDDDGNPMTTEEWRKHIEENPKQVIGSGTYEDPYRLPGTEPHG